jgi:hypothetical protein
LIVAVHQPQYLPWLGYFDKMRRVDVFCYLDNVQYKKNDWQNRNRVKTARDWQWLTVPVCYRYPQKINEVIINNKVNWRNKHLQALITNYSRAPYFKDYLHLFEVIYAKDWQSLVDLNIHLIEEMKTALKLEHRTTVRASDFDLSEDATDRLISICKALNADTYLSGQDGTTYMNMERFRQAGIKVVVQEFKHPIYPQVFDGFQSHLSVVDLLFNCGPEALEIIAEINPLVATLG